MSKYLSGVLSPKATPQSQPIPGTAQVPNSAGGHAWAVDDWTRLDRFLILGSEGGSYYATESKLTLENALSVQRCIVADGLRAVRRIVEVSHAGRAPKNDPAIFALALAASKGDAATKAAALAALPRVCRIGTHLFHFAEYVDGLRGWGRGLRAAVGNWYQEQDAAKLALQLTKYQSRDGWSHRDLLRLSHPKSADPARNALYRLAVGKEYELRAMGEVAGYVGSVAELAVETDAKRAAHLIREHRIPRECVPTQFLTDGRVWEALLEEMPLTALIRNLATMTRVGLLAPLSAAAQKVTGMLGDAERIKQARVHPIAVLSALKTYAQGHGERGGNTWSPVAQVVDALDAAFYLSFGSIVPTERRWLLALDVSGSMSSGVIAGVPGLTPRVASAAMALITAATERQYVCVGFTAARGGYGGQWGGGTPGLTPLAISPRQRLDDVLRLTDGLPFGGTDCALPMLHARKERLEVDAFVVYTDSETWAGGIHPVQALRQYRDETGIAAKLIVVGMVANEFSIADPDDAGMLDVVGFDTATPNLMSEFVMA